MLPEKGKHIIFVSLFFIDTMKFWTFYDYIYLTFVSIYREIVEEIQYTSGLIEEITGEKPAFFRPPFIDYDQKMYDLIDLGFICGYGCEDWLPTVTAQERIDRVLHDANPGFIILLHDMTDNTNTVEAIKTIIPELKKQGYEFVTVRDLFQKSSIKPQRNAIYMGVNEVREETPM